MSTAFDFYFSFRSPYSYLALPQIEAGIQRYGFEPCMRIVLPIAVRIPGFFKAVNPLWPPYLMRDTMRIAQMQSIPYRWPRPDPIVMDIATGEVAADQPYIHRVSRLGVAATREGRGFAFVKRMATAIWSGDVSNWHEDAHAMRALTDAGLDAGSIIQKSRKTLLTTTGRSRATKRTRSPLGIGAFRSSFSRASRSSDKTGLSI